MKLESILAAASALALAAGAALAQAPAGQAAPAATTPQPRKYDVTKAAGPSVKALMTAVKAKKNEEVPALLAAADAAAKTNDDKYFVAKLRLEHALNLKDKAAQAAAIDAILATGSSDAAEAAQLRFAQGQLAMQAGNFAAAEATFGQLIGSDASNVDLVANLARAKIGLKKDGEALPLLQRAIGLAKASGKKGEEAWYRYVLQIADQQGNRSLALEMSREVLSLYPNEANLRNAIIVYQKGAALDAEGEIDLLRLMRASKTLSPQAYRSLAEMMSSQRLFGEAKSVLDEATQQGAGSGVAPLLAEVNRQIPAQRAELPAIEREARAAANGRLAMTAARAHFGYGDYAKAAELYRLALAKGGVDSNVVNTRLGIALAYAGQKAEAEAAFKAVTGARAELASLWLAWLNQRA